ncbi:MAG: hypothetical protein ACRBN8_28565 [Nannocystales bacterium]
MWSRDRILVLATVGFLVVPVLADLALGGQKRVFGYLAIDFFYYETIARNYLELGFPTFDQEFPTNGFHPVWQYTLIAFAWFCTAVGASKLSFFSGALLLSMGLVAGALILFAQTFKAAEGRVPLFLPWAVPGVFALLTSPIYQPSHDFGRLRVAGGERAVVGTLWRYVNGMETGLVLLAFFASTLLMVRLLKGETSRNRILGCGAMLGLLALSRLDHAVFSLSLPLALVLGRLRDRRAWLTVVQLWGVVFAFLAAYVVFNLVNHGAAVPVSGSVKSTFPHFTADNWRDLSRLLAGKQSIWVHDAWRLSQEILPVLVVVAYISCTVTLRPKLRLRDGANALDKVLLAAVPGVLAIAVYNFGFVRSDFQGHWYFPVSVVLCSAFALRVAGRLGVEERFTSTRRRAMVFVVSTVAVLGFFAWGHYRPNFNDDVVEFYVGEGPKIRAFYDEPPKVLEFYDAVFASATEFPTMNGYGLVVDPEAAQARKQSLDAVFELAVSRGFDRIVSFNLNGVRLSEKPKRRELLGVLKRYVSEEALAPYRIVLEYRSETGRHLVFRVVERGRRRKNGRRRGHGRKSKT